MITKDTAKKSPWVTIPKELWNAETLIDIALGKIKPKEVEEHAKNFYKNKDNKTEVANEK